MKKNKTALGIALVLGATLIWGSSFIIMKSTLSAIPPLLLLTIRFCGAALLLAAVSGKRLKKIDKGYLVGGFLIGLSVFVAYIFQTYGLMDTTPGKNAFLTAAYCVMMPFLCWLLDKKRPGVRSLVAAAVCIAGVGLLSLGGGDSGGLRMGDVLTLGAALCFTFQIYFIDKYAAERDGLLITCLQFAFAGLFCGVGTLIFEKPPASLPTDAVLSIVYLCVFGSAAAFLMQILGQKLLDPLASSLLMTCEAVFGALFSVAFGYEKMTLSIAAGFVLMLSAVLLSQLKPGERKGRSKRLTAPR